MMDAIKCKWRVRVTGLDIARALTALICGSLLAGCAMKGGGLCRTEPVMVLKTQGGGSEDIVALPLGDAEGTMRLFIREICNDSNGSLCKSGQWRVGRVDIATGNLPAPTAHAWRPEDDGKDSPFLPLGMSLVLGAEPGSATLFVVDIANTSAVRIWQLRILDGNIIGARSINSSDPDARAKLKGANDLQAIREEDRFLVYITRFDEYSLLPWRTSTWPALVKMRDGAPLETFAEGFRSANGIIDPCPNCDLVIASYWERRLRFISKAKGEINGFASGEFPIRPDNLTLDGERILIAGQHGIFLTFLNLFVSSRIPSPSAVYAIDIKSLHSGAIPQLLWEGGWRFGRSVAVAVPITGSRLAIGQISTPGILVVDCPAHTKPVNDIQSALPL